MKIIRSSTFEGMADKNGFPLQSYKKLYENLAKNQVKHIITGVMFTSNNGRAMHPGQAGIDCENKIEAYREITNIVHEYGSKIYAQLGYSACQTKNTGYEILGISEKKSKYFGETPKRVLTTKEIYEIADSFANSAFYARDAGFDGIQLHGAHGYIIHQFFLKSFNDRQDEFQNGEVFLKLVIEKIIKKCGNEFPIWIKISGDNDLEKTKFEGFKKFVQFLDTLKLNLIEISYGTMDYPLNVFRGTKIPVKVALKHSPIFKSKGIFWKINQFLKTKKFKPMYNLQYAKIAQSLTEIPISVVGGFRTGTEIFNCGIKNVSLCRPLICEPDFLVKLNVDKNYKSRCTNCNICAIMVDSKNGVRCYKA